MRIGKKEFLRFFQNVLLPNGDILNAFTPVWDRSCKTCFAPTVVLSRKLQYRHSEILILSN